VIGKMAGGKMHYEHVEKRKVAFSATVSYREYFLDSNSVSWSFPRHFLERDVSRPAFSTAHVCILDIPEI